MTTISPLAPIAGSILYGVDLYHGDFDNDDPNSIQFHDLVSAGLSFVILKAAQSTSEVDPVFANCWPRAKEAGLVRGAYLFFDPTADPVAQAQHLLAQATLETGDIPFTLDVETAGASVAENAFTAAQYIKDQTGYWPWIYTSDSFYQSYLKSQFPSDLYTLWIARYGAQPVTPYACWQYSESGNIPGVSSQVDLDVFPGTLAELNARCVK